MEKDYTMFGTKVFNKNKKGIGLLLYTWKNVYADGIFDFATCVDKNGKRYIAKLDDLKPIEE